MPITSLEIHKLQLGFFHTVYEETEIEEVFPSVSPKPLPCIQRRWYIGITLLQVLTTKEKLAFLFFQLIIVFNFSNCSGMYYFNPSPYNTFLVFFLWCLCRVSS